MCASSLSSNAIILGVILFACLMVLENHHVDASPYEDICNMVPSNFLFCMKCLERKLGHEIQNDKQQEEQQSEGDVQVKKLVAKLIDCARRSSKIARKPMIDASNNSTDTRLQEAAIYCVPKLKSVEAQFFTALEFWNYDRKSDALNAIKTAQNDYYDCAARTPHEMPQLIIHVLNCIRARGEVAEKVISALQNNPLWSTNSTTSFCLPSNSHNLDLHFRRLRTGTRRVGDSNRRRPGNDRSIAGRPNTFRSFPTDRYYAPGPSAFVPELGK
ncbi:OLC1v1035693C1 [Oldenlandia corymbosa var. corymbosa]|uniref:OLC1v1035693C1 n=1 Tax=Oldenlandia corymbosa var. corymbosa TaxID=529605 RepID=A0AAV1CTL2_OLDCO|nr:OLC1v1035693C1 [Oldenlandia corymbosa var. corymbosa]